MGREKNTPKCSPHLFVLSLFLLSGANMMFTNFCDNDKIDEPLNFGERTTCANLWGWSLPGAKPPPYPLPFFSLHQFNGLPSFFSFLCLICYTFLPN